MQWFFMFGALSVFMTCAASTNITSCTLLDAMTMSQCETLDGKPIYQEVSQADCRQLLVFLSPLETEDLGYGYLTFKYRLNGVSDLRYAYDSQDIFNNRYFSSIEYRLSQQLGWNVAHAEALAQYTRYLEREINPCDCDLPYQPEERTTISVSDGMAEPLVEVWRNGRIKVLRGAAIYLFKNSSMDVADIRFEKVENPNTTTSLWIDDRMVYPQWDGGWEMFHSSFSFHCELGEFSPIQKITFTQRDYHGFYIEEPVFLAGNSGKSGYGSKWFSASRDSTAINILSVGLSVVGINENNSYSFLDWIGDGYAMNYAVDVCPWSNMYWTHVEPGGMVFDSEGWHWGGEEVAAEIDHSYGDPGVELFLETPVPQYVYGCCYDEDSDRGTYRLEYRTPEYSGTGTKVMELSINGGYALVGFQSSNSLEQYYQDYSCSVCSWESSSMDVYPQYFHIGIPVIYKDDFNMSLPHDSLLYVQDPQMIDLASPETVPEGYRFVKWEMIPWKDYEEQGTDKSSHYVIPSEEVLRLAERNGCYPDHSFCTQGSWDFSYVTTNAIVAHAVWQRLPAPPIVTINRADGYVFSGSVRVGMSTSDPAAKIYYTLDGSEPTTNSALYTASLTLKTSTIIRAIAYIDLDGFLYAGLGTRSAVYKMTAAPTIIAADAFEGDSSEVSIMADEGLEVYYTLDGTEPSPQNGTLYTRPFRVWVTTNIRATGYFNDIKVSDTAEWRITSLTPPDGSGNKILAVSAEELDPTSKIVRVTYTIGGNSCVEHTDVSLMALGVIAGVTNILDVAKSLNVAAGTWSFDWDYSHFGKDLSQDDEVVLVLGEGSDKGEKTKIDVFPRVVFSVPDGTQFLKPLSLELMASVSDSTIFYTMLDSGSFDENGIVYAGAITVDEECTISAMAISPTGKRGGVTSYSYSPCPILPPTIAPGDGHEFSGHCEVNIFPSNEMYDVVLYYTLNGDDPRDAGIPYGGPLEITGSTTVKAVAWQPDAGRFSSVVTAYIARAWSYGVSIGQDDLVMSSSGDVQWIRDKVMSHDGHESLCSGRSGLLEPTESVLSTTVSGPTQGSFFWKASCECGEEVDWDFGVFAIDGIEIARIGGETDWEKVSFSVTNERAVLTWTYHKDDWNDIYEFQDCIWLDELVLEEDPIPELPIGANADDIRNALAGSMDASLIDNITDAETYNAYRVWADSVVDSSGRFIGHSAMKLSEMVWLSFALDHRDALGRSVLMERMPKKDDLKIDCVQYLNSGSFRVRVSLMDEPIGPSATMDNLCKVFGVEGAYMLAGESFSEDNVAVETVRSVDGRVEISARLKDPESKSGFIRVLFRR